MAVDFSDLGAQPVGAPPRSKGVDLSDLGALPVATPPAATGTPLLVAHTATPAPTPTPAPTTAPAQPLSARIGNLIPNATVPALAWANKYLVQPFDNLAQKGAQIGAKMTEPIAPATPEEKKQMEAQGIEVYKPPAWAVGAQKAIFETAGAAVADPRNWPLLASGAARPMLQRLISGGFGVMMGAQATSAATDLYKNWDKYTPQQRAQIATQAGLTAAMAAAASTHAISGGTTAPAEQPKGVDLSDLGAKPVEIRPEAARPTPTPEAQPAQAGVDFSDLGSKAVPLAPQATAAAQTATHGENTTVKTPSSDLPARYKLVEASDLVPSHDAETFAPNPKYPAGVQERTYQTSKEAQNRVIQQAQQYDPRYTVNTNPDAVNGPPIVTPEGVVLGGNSRAMSTQRLYNRGQGATYQDYLRDNAEQFGISADDVNRFRAPVLVREVAAPADIEAARRLGSELNKVPTGALGVSEKAVSAGKSITPDTLTKISGMLDNMGPDTSLRDLLRDRGRDVLSLMVRDGAITERERPQFVDTATGGLSEEGKTFVERALLGTVVDDPVLMDRVPKSVLGKLGGSLADLATIAPRSDDYNILPLVREALREHADIAQRGADLDTYLGQRSIFGSDRNPAVEAIVRKLAEKPKAVKEAFRGFARDAGIDRQGQGFLGMMEPPTAIRAFADAFGDQYASRPGPGAKTFGPSEMPGTPLEQLTESLRGKQLAPQSSAVSQAATHVSNTLRSVSQTAADAFGKAQAVADSLWQRYRKPEPWTDFKDALGKYQGQLQYGDWQLKKFSDQIRTALPSKLRREAITNWIQADGSADTLRQRAEASNAQLAPGYHEALSLSPEERTLANNIRNHFDAKLEEAQKAGLLEQGVENYVNQIWDKSDNPAAKRLRAAAAFNELQPNPSFIKRRVFDSYFDGEQAGFRPKDKDIGALVSAYNQAFNRAIASRAFIKSLHDATASDGRPLVEVSGAGRQLGTGPTGDYPLTGIRITDNDPTGYVVTPRTKPGEAFDYRVVDHPALRQWKWATKDADGKPIFVQGDMVVHPEVYQKLKNILGQSAIRQSALGRGVLNVSREFKQSLLSLSPFHQVQLGIHALEHMVNPFSVPKLDLNDATQRALVDHGLMVSDFHGMQEFSEGVSGAGIVSKTPLIGSKFAAYQDWLFRDYIPRLKMAMAQHALERNFERYGTKLSGDQILEMTANQGNSAFGALNYKMLARNATAQDAFRLIALAPDFLEARARFVGQALKPFGREQSRALALGAMGMIAAKTIIGQIAGEEQNWHPDHLFYVKLGGREYGLRTVQGDLAHLLTNPNSFTQYRLNPATSRPLFEWIYGRDAFGRQRTTYQQLKDYFTSAIPIPLKGLVNKSEHDLIDTLLQSVGVQARKYRDSSGKAASREDMNRAAGALGFDNAPNNRRK